jgi:hypothetical protein
MMPVARIGRNDEDPRVHGVVDSCRVTTEREQPNRQNELARPRAIPSDRGYRRQIRRQHMDAALVRVKHDDASIRQLVKGLDAREALSRDDCGSREDPEGYRIPRLLRHPRTSGSQCANRECNACTHAIVRLA